MEPSDWIAAGALFVAAASIFFNYLTNRENIKARRAEIAAGKSIEAYREVVEKLHALLKQVTNERVKKNEGLPYLHALELTKDLGDIWEKYNLYFPVTLGNDFLQGLQEIRYVLNTDDEHFDAAYIRAFERFAELKERFQKYIGVEPEEISRIIRRAKR